MSRLHLETKKKKTVGDKTLTIIISALKTVPKTQEKSLDELEIQRRIKTVQIMIVFSPVRILWKVLEIWKG